MIPSLVPYGRNTIRIDDRAVDISTLLDTTDKIAVPMWRSGLLLRFKPQETTGATLILQTDEGGLIPAGAKATAGSEEAEVAFHGEVFLSTIKAGMRVHVDWPGHACELTVGELPNAILPKMGPLSCR